MEVKSYDITNIVESWIHTASSSLRTSSLSMTRIEATSSSAKNSRLGYRSSLSPTNSSTKRWSRRNLTNSSGKSTPTTMAESIAGSSTITALRTSPPND